MANHGLKGCGAIESVYVILGGGSTGMVLTNADAWLDDLVANKWR